MTTLKYKHIFLWLSLVENEIENIQNKLPSDVTDTIQQDIKDEAESSDGQIKIPTIDSYRQTQTFTRQTGLDVDKLKKRLKICHEMKEFILAELETYEFQLTSKVQNKTMFNKPVTSLGNKDE